MREKEKKEVTKGVRKREIFGDEKRWMEGQHAREKENVLLSVGRVRGGEGGENGEGGG